MQSEQSIAHTAADQKCLIAGLVQPVQDFQRTVGDLVPGDVMRGAGNDLGYGLLRNPAFIQLIYRLSIKYWAV